MRLTIRIVLIALASLILILTISKHLARKSAGIYVELPLHVTRSDCGERRDIVLQISNEGSLRINAETVSREKFGERLRDLYRVRVERVLFVTADSNVRFQGVVGIIDEARGSVTNLYVTLLTPAG
jgi:biopolymer transport protein ExbD